MPFTVIRRDDLSLADLCRLDKEGQSVTKTPHPGNIYLNNLAVAKLGLRLLFHDRTFGRKDLNFHPHKVIRGGESEIIADPDVMMTHARVLQPSRLMNGHFPVGNRVAQCHLNALAEAVPGVRMRLYSEFLAEHEELVFEVLNLCSSVILPPKQGWKRVVGEDGRASIRSLTTWQRIVSEGIYGLRGKTAGWVMPNVFNILMDGVIESLQFKTSDVYHLSGPDMIIYIKMLEGALNTLYEKLLGHIPGLPEEIRFHVVPVASMRLVTTLDRADKLDRVMMLYLQLRDENREVGATLQAVVSTGDRDALIKQWGMRRRALQGELRAATKACPEIFYDITRGTFVSQYDAMGRGGVYVHPWGIENPVSAVAKAMQDLQSLFEQ